jgi:hypothetical protein
MFLIFLLILDFTGSDIPAVVGSPDIILIVDSCAAIDPAVADVLTTLEVPKSLLRLETLLLLPAIFLLSLLLLLSFVLLPMFLLHIIHVPGGPAKDRVSPVARVSAVANVLTAASVPNLSGDSAVPGDSAIVGVPAALAPFNVAGIPAIA